VLAIARQPAQYQAPLFRQMVARSDLALQVAYCTLRGAEAEHEPEFGRPCIGMCHCWTDTGGCRYRTAGLTERVFGAAEYGAVADDSRRPI
jgi:hypothetical protein